jgi:hypothetical protein
MSLDFDELQQEAERLNEQPGGGNNEAVLEKYVIFPEGDGAVTVRLLPPAPGRKFYQWTRTHRLQANPEDKRSARNIHCPKVLQGGKFVGECEICKYASWLWKQSEEPGRSEGEKNAFQNKYRQIKATERYYYNCIVRAQMNPKTEKLEHNVGPKILSVGKMVHKMIVRAIIGDPEMNEAPLGDVTDVKEGRDFKIMKRMVKGATGEYPQYNDSKFLDKSPLGDQEKVAKWLGELHDLTALRVVKTAEEIDNDLAFFMNGGRTEKNTFDPSRFMKKGAASTSVNVPKGVEDLVKEEVAKNELPARTPSPVEAQAAGVEDDTMSDEDFVKTLQGMKKS